MFRSPAINVYSHDVMRLVSFYEDLGFHETFRTPEEGTPVHSVAGTTAVGELALGRREAGCGLLGCDRRRGAGQLGAHRLLPRLDRVLSVPHAPERSAPLGRPIVAPTMFADADRVH